MVSYPAIDHGLRRRPGPSTVTWVDGAEWTAAPRHGIPPLEEMAWGQAGQGWASSICGLMAIIVRASAAGVLFQA